MHSRVLYRSMICLDEIQSGTLLYNAPHHQQDGLPTERRSFAKDRVVELAHTVAQNSELSPGLAENSHELTTPQ